MRTGRHAGLLLGLGSSTYSDVRFDWMQVGTIVLRRRGVSVEPRPHEIAAGIVA